MTTQDDQAKRRELIQNVFNDCTSGWLITVKSFNGDERNFFEFEEEIIGGMLETLDAYLATERERERLKGIRDGYNYALTYIDISDSKPDAFRRVSEAHKKAVERCDG